MYGIPYVMSGQDEILDMICNRANRNPYGIQMMRAYMGSYNGLYAMYQGQVMVADLPPVGSRNRHL